jgi:hypothetical protein
LLVVLVILVPSTCVVLLSVARRESGNGERIEDLKLIMGKVAEVGNNKECQLSMGGLDAAAFGCGCGVARHGPVLQPAVQQRAATRQVLHQSFLTAGD